MQRVPDISGRENFRTEPLNWPGLNAVRIRRDPVEPVPAGTYVAMVFRVTGYDQDCDGHLMARLENVDAAGEETGWSATHLGLDPESTWVVPGPGALDDEPGE